MLGFYGMYFIVILMLWLFDMDLVYENLYGVDIIWYDFFFCICICNDRCVGLIFV